MLRAALIVAISLAGCSDPLASGAGVAATVVAEFDDLERCAVELSGAWRGEFHPCDCASAMSGGLARAAARWKRPGAVGIAVGPALSQEPELARHEVTALARIFADTRIAAVTRSPRDVVAAAGAGLDWDSVAPARVANAMTWRDLRGRSLYWTHVPVGDSAPAEIADAAARVNAARRSATWVLVSTEMESGDLAALMRAIDAADLLVVVGNARRTPETRRVGRLPVIVAGPRGSDAVVATLSESAGVAASLVGLTPDVPRDPAAWAAVEEMYRAHASLGVAAMRPADGKHVERPENCGSCHGGELRKWRESGHSRAWSALPEYRRGDARCAACHSVMVEDAEARPAFIENVVCAACHSAPPGHGSTAASRVTTSLDCARCHDLANSPLFELDTYLARVRCCREADPRSSK